VKRIIPIALGLVCALNLVGAQPSTQKAPLFLNLNHDIYVYETVPGTLKRLTTWQGNDAPMISPDSRRIAYTSEASQAREATIRTNNVDAGFNAKNLWLMDTASKQVTRIADQPTDVSIQVKGKPDVYLGRSDPVWSPDGRMVAWTEAFNAPRSQRRLAIYTLASKTTKTVPLEPSNDSDYPSPLKLRWGVPGIAIGWFDQAIKKHQIDVFNPNADRIAHYQFTNDRVNINEYNMVWLERAGRWWLGTIESAALLDPVLGAVGERSGFMVFTRLGSSPGLKFYPSAFNMLTLEITQGDAIQFAGLDPLSKYSFRYPDALPSFAGISPDGQRAVFLERTPNGSSVLWLLERGANKKLQQKVLTAFSKDENVTSLAWAHTSWHTK
jgi:WD40-like Beta Propeller Repeat